MINFCLNMTEMLKVSKIMLFNFYIL